MDNKGFQSGFRLGRLLGIEVRVDYSLMIIFALVALSLGAGVLPSWHPEWGFDTVWIVAIVAAILFFASIFIHEMSHALVARAFNLPVRTIRLFIFGGMADIEHEPESPKAEALIAVVGPVTSIVLGVLFSVLGASFAGPAAAEATDPIAALRAMGPIPTMLAWLGPINILLGVFNLLPGFPMDGGRVLRAIVWKATGNFYRATRWASYAGQGIASLLIAAGVLMAFGFRVPIFGTGLVGGIWLVLIGWFLSTAAAMHRGQLRVQLALEGTPVRRIMRRNLPSPVPAAESIDQFVDGYVMGSNEGAFVVTDEGRVLGIVRPEDVRRVARDAWSQTPISEITINRRELEATTPEEDAFSAMKRMRKSPGNIMLVMEDERLVGLLGTDEISRWVQIQSGSEETPAVAPKKPSEPHGRGGEEALGHGTHAAGSRP